MAKLKHRLKRELGDWRSQLPPLWRKAFEKVELDFDRVSPDSTLKSSEAIWPQSTGGPKGAHLFKALKYLIDYYRFLEARQLIKEKKGGT